MKKPKKPKETASVRALRERQVRDLADLDEDENLRIKRALHPNKRAYRRSGRGRGSVRASAGSTGQAANDRAGTGFDRP